MISWLKTQHSENEDHGIQSRHFMAYKWETIETVTDFIFLGSKITADGDCNHEIKRRLLLGRKAMTILDRILKSRDITLPTIHVVKTVVFPLVMYGCESWTIKKVKWKSLSRVRLFVIPWDYTVHGILQARILEWVPIPFSRGSSQMLPQICRQHCRTPRTVRKQGNVASSERSPGSSSNWAPRRGDLQLTW